MQEIKTKDELSKQISASKENPVLFYKHSHRCSICTAAHEQVEKFAEKHPELPCFLIDVIDSREVSLDLAGKSGIKHESPQAIFYQHESPVWNASHRSITTDALEKQFSRLS